MDRERVLIVGVGNPCRRDDGLAWYVVNEWRTRTGQPLLGQWDDGLDELGQEIDSVFLPQLAPELAALASQYEMLIIVDARVGGADGVKADPITDQPEREPHLLTHELLPEQLVSLARVVYGHAPRAWLMSARGYDFDFGPER